MDDGDIYGDLGIAPPAPRVPVALQTATIASPPTFSPPATVPPITVEDTDMSHNFSGAGLGYSKPAVQEDNGAFDFEDGIVVDSGKVLGPSEKGAAADSAAAALRRQRDKKPRSFDDLRKELEDDEARPAAGHKASEVVDLESTDEEDAEGGDLAIELGEVKASETGTKVREHRPRPHWQPPGQGAPAPQAAPAPKPGTVGAAKRGVKRKEITVFIGAPPPLPQGQGTADCFILIGGLPWWLSDADLRGQAEHYGQVRTIRILDFERSGKSAGIAAVEYTQPEFATRAADSVDGMRSRPVWKQITGKKAPKLVLVSNELLKRFKAGVLPWSEGGPCSEELRSILMRQFDMSYVPQRRPGPDNTRGVTRQNSNTAADRAWADKRNTRQEVPASFALAPGCRVRVTDLQSANAYNGLMGIVHSWDQVEQKWRVQLETPDRKMVFFEGSKLHVSQSFDPRRGRP